MYLHNIWICVWKTKYRLTGQLFERCWFVWGRLAYKSVEGCWDGEHIWTAKFLGRKMEWKFLFLSLELFVFVLLLGILWNINSCTLFQLLLRTSQTYVKPVLLNSDLFYLFGTNPSIIISEGCETLQGLVEHWYSLIHLIYIRNYY